MKPIQGRDKKNRTAEGMRYETACAIAKAADLDLLELGL